MPETPDTRTAAVRKAVFAALVEAQDGGLAPAASRLKVALAFGVPVDTVAEVEREGLEKEWPPL